MPVKIEMSEPGFNSQLKNFSSKIGTYATALGVTTAEVTSIKADSAAIDYIMTCQASIQAYAHNFTAFKNILRRGNQTTLGALPTLAAFHYSSCNACRQC
ncbi:MAG: hypothetical protein QM734_14535 [Cyclobacteriaceae bacterium]